MKRLLFFLLVIVFSSVAQDITQADVLAGFNTHSAILQRVAVMPPSTVVSAVDSVYRNMVSTSTYSSGTTIPPSLFVLNTPEINAYATFGGRMYVNRGLVEAVRGNQGILAFVMGHEMIHNRNQHGIKRYYRAVNAQYTIRMAYRQNTWAGIAAEAANKIAEAKLQRDEEHEADRLGLFMAAEAGYHPDFGILASRVLKMTTGESSKFAAFFQGHPRWATREQRAESTRLEALRIFESRWPNAVDSPGGEPPTMVAVEDVKVAKTGKSEMLTFFTDVRHLRGSPVEINAVVVREKTSEPVSVAHQTFVASADKTWSVDLGQRPKDKLGKRFVRITATQDGNALFETDLKRID